VRTGRAGHLVAKQLVKPADELGLSHGELADRGRDIVIRRSRAPGKPKNVL
jgi:hypothetical protein